MVKITFHREILMIFIIMIMSPLCIARGVDILLYPCPLSRTILNCSGGLNFGDIRPPLASVGWYYSNELPYEICSRSESD